MRREISEAETNVRHQRLANAEQLANLAIRGLAAGQAVEIDGLGTFYRTRGAGFASSLAGSRRCFWRM